MDAFASSRVNRVPTCLGCNLAVEIAIGNRIDNQLADRSLVQGRNNRFVLLNIFNLFARNNLQPCSGNIVIRPNACFVVRALLAHACICDIHFFVRASVP